MNSRFRNRCPAFLLLLLAGCSGVDPAKFTTVFAHAESIDCDEIETFTQHRKAYHQQLEILQTKNLNQKEEKIAELLRQAGMKWDFAEEYLIDHRVGPTPTDRQRGLRNACDCILAGQMNVEEARRMVNNRRPLF
ncbi:hypothetical protein Pan216_14270 [Planctomycetes bacterium Pan216]|uniref:Lipoprotein n=1 Tax=Kolteria novifilia TaxID=2527975 RepID=A0A518B0U5_9BACT|nr:hypothetical protein Pan216_14270 [Planctomycetes bacterium Pan216]